MDIIKKINVGGYVSCYKLHRVDQADSLFYYNNCFSENETIWKFHYDGWMDDGEPDLEFENDRRVNNANYYLRFKEEDLAQG